jgi:hypothetical protein
MLFAAKTKSFFVEQTEHGTLLARTSTTLPPLVVEEVIECKAGDSAALAEAIKKLQGNKAGATYLHACCGIYPSSRVVRRVSLEQKRMKEPGYLPEILNTQLRVDPEKFTVHVLHAPDGTDLDLAKGTQKEALFCGLPADDIVAAQDSLLEQGIYPERLELGSVGMLGALSDYLVMEKSRTPTLVLELEANATHSFIVTGGGVDASRPIAQGYDSMVTVVQKELGLKDEESARKLLLSNTFDFTGMGPSLVKKLMKELQSSIGFYEVQTGQSVGQVLCTSLPPQLAWLEGAIATALGVGTLQLDLRRWLQTHQITVPENVVAGRLDPHWLGLFGLMVPHNTPDAVAAEKKE